MNSYKCQICSRKFTRKYSLKCHLETHEKNRSKIQCVKCGGGYSTAYNLKKHKESCNATKSRPPKAISTERSDKKFICETCGKAYDRKHDLKMHILIVHVGITKFNCVKCSSNFSRKSDLLRHMRNFHPNTEHPAIQLVKKNAITKPPAHSLGGQQPKKIGNRTMHALIAKGAENMTGPWLCLECGSDGRPISMPSYRSFRLHLTKIHKQKIDPRICEHCGHRANERDNLHYHILIEHNLKPPNDLQFPKCELCTFIAFDQTALCKHKERDHQSLEHMRNMDEQHTHTFMSTKQ